MKITYKIIYMLNKFAYSKEKEGKYMFCEKCGTQLPDTAKFCTNCGTNITGNIKNPEQNIEDTNIQLLVKPTFSFGYIVLPSLIAYSILTIICALIFSTISPTVGGVITLIVFLTLALTLGIKAAFNKKQYASCSYNFYKTKVVYKDSFLNVSEKEVKYKYIREVTMQKTFIQRLFNLGNIILFTNAETGYDNGIHIMNVKDSDNIYRQIKEIINI